MKNYRIGTGYDVHRLVVDEKLILGGVHIPFEKGTLGHSDADVLIHAICDALLGALALGDIGQHFPDTDPKWKNVSSSVFLKEVNKMLILRGYKIENLDSTIVLQKPKLLPYLSMMRKNIADILQVSVENISVKATTSEGLGFEGLGEGVSAQAICLIYK